MAPVINGRHIFNEVPTGYPVPGKTTVYDATQTVDLENVPLQGGFLVKTLVLSIDPYMRGRMRDAAIKSYSPAFPLGQPLTNFGVGTVLRSENPAFQAGDHIYGMFPFEEYLERVCWSSWHARADSILCQHFKGEVAFITTGAGAVGSLVIQLAKRDGLKVIASAGSDEKVAFMKEIGADVAFNYKTTKTSEVLEKEGPIDIYWDNVGGETLEAALTGAARNARFINLMNIVAKEIKIYGFIVGSISPKYIDAFYAEVPELIASGAFKLKEDFTRGLESVGEAILAVQKGTNTGKSVVVVADK